MNRIPEKLLLIFFFMLLFCSTYARVLPFVKHYETGDTVFRTEGFSILDFAPGLKHEAGYLEKALEERKFSIHPGGLAVRLELSDPGLPEIHSDYHESIKSQGYHLQVSGEEILIQSLTPRGIFYAIRTLLQLIGPKGELPEVNILDWPDFSMRMIMTDPARQNENFSYYKRMIRFCGENKINYIQVHLTDHQTSTLYHKDYSELMHRHAWTEGDISDLVAYAEKYHVTLLPEIESFGHSRMFIRLRDATDYLHQTEMMETVGWTIIDIPGYTSVLCPASDQALHYLGEMYQKAVPFGSESIHIGFDEVDMSNCPRCNEKFGNPSQTQLFQHHLLQCLDIAGDHYSSVGIWGDMLVKNPAILAELPRDKIMVYDWNYNPEVDPASVKLFRDEGFEVIACPSLMCWPYILLPSENNYRNIRSFMDLAREYDLAGVNTTIWLPQRYVSDGLWPGISYAASQSWGGSRWDEAIFHKRFFQNFFGSEEGVIYRDVWDRLIRNIPAQDLFSAGSWNDKEGLAEAVDIVQKRGVDLGLKRDEMKRIAEDLSSLGPRVTRHRTEWHALETVAAIQDYLLEHLLSATRVKKGDQWNLELIRELDLRCIELMSEIERDWDRNRYPDDVNKKGIYQEGEHLLHMFRIMHQFHTEILQESSI
ncbi:MAG: family 20 glycosylhydrolase [Bacteroidetes bacterium]|nr:family 20 glycosylhydrolase [Bacteroidota bacterium]